MTQHLIQILLPIHRRDGTAVPAEMFARVRRDLTERFGGVTAYSRSPATGLWKHDGDAIEHDDVIMVEVVVETFDRDWWTGYREQLETRFGQEAMHARVIAMEQI
jgi:hypothetical protein